MAMGVAADSPKPPRPPGHSDVVGIGLSQRASVPVHAGSPPVAKLLQPCLGRLSAGHTDTHHECLDIGSHTLAGTRYSGLNQDYMVVQELYTSQEIPRGGQQTYVVAICDGHGILGDKSACFAGKALARHVYMSQLRNKHLARLHGHEVEDEMKVAFKKAHHAANLVYDMPPKHVDYPNIVGASKLTTYTLVDQEGIKSYRSGKGSEKMLECGTTCTAAIIQGRCVCLANVGDSLAVVGRERQGTVSCETVTVRHHGLLESERQRIIDNHSATTEVLPDGYIKVCVGPWAGYELAVTRALGHKNMEPLGVLDDPHCVMLDMDPASACCLILASDGLWDVMNGDEAVAYVMDGRRKGQTAAAVAHGLVELAVQRGLDTLEEQDNTSAIVVFFRHLE